MRQLLLISILNFSCFCSAQKEIPAHLEEEYQYLFDKILTLDSLGYVGGEILMKTNDYGTESKLKGSYTALSDTTYSLTVNKHRFNLDIKSGLVEGTVTGSYGHRNRRIWLLLNQSEDVTQRGLDTLGAHTKVYEGKDRIMRVVYDTIFSGNEFVLNSIRYSYTVNDDESLNTFEDRKRQSGSYDDQGRLLKLVIEDFPTKQLNTGLLGYGLQKRTEVREYNYFYSGDTVEVRLTHFDHGYGELPQVHSAPYDLTRQAFREDKVGLTTDYYDYKARGAMIALHQTTTSWKIDDEQVVYNLLDKRELKSCAECSLNKDEKTIEFTLSKFKKRK